MKNLGTFLFAVCSLWWVSNEVEARFIWSNLIRSYNTTYPLTAPVRVGDEIHYRLAIISDLDKDTKDPEESNQYISYFKQGILKYNTLNQSVNVEWDPEEPTVLKSKYSNGGRGMELSELIVYDGRLITFDDRSGIVYAIENMRVVPWVIMTDGNGHAVKGFKSEWATVKDNLLYVGSTGKEWTSSTGEFLSYNPMWIKVINAKGEVQHKMWVDEYDAVRKSVGYGWPGYMWHESGVWSKKKKLWHFLPRRCSAEGYTDEKVEVAGCNYLITADEDFKNVRGIEVTTLEDPKRGFSTFKFVPNTNDEIIVALKTVEFQDVTSTYISAFTTHGTELLHDTLVENRKYEGLEFI